MLIWNKCFAFFLRYPSTSVRPHNYLYNTRYLDKSLKPQTKAVWITSTILFFISFYFLILYYWELYCIILWSLINKHFMQLYLKTHHFPPTCKTPAASSSALCGVGIKWDPTRTGYLKKLLCLPPVTSVYCLPYNNCFIGKGWHPQLNSSFLTNFPFTWGTCLSQQRWQCLIKFDLLSLWQKSMQTLTGFNLIA